MAQEASFDAGESVDSQNPGNPSEDAAFFMGGADGVDAVSEELFGLDGTGRSLSGGGVGGGDEVVFSFLGIPTDGGNGRVEDIVFSLGHALVEIDRKKEELDQSFAGFLVHDPVRLGFSLFLTMGFWGGMQVDFCENA